MTNFQRAPRGTAKIGLAVSAALIAGMSLPGVGSAQTVTSGTGAMGRGHRLRPRRRIAAELPGPPAEGSVGGADQLVRPLLRVAELLEAVPGMVAVQHSGSGKANQYFLRGFNLDHGTDFTTYIDGGPWNLRSHGHGQGYLDVNGLLPEIVERIDYRKGPYRADVGDFSMAAASFIRTIDRLDSSFLSLESGENQWGRLAAGTTTDIGDGALTTIGEYKTYGGPWQRSEDLSHVSVWSKYLKPTDFGQVSFTLSGYEGDWHPTEQVPERAIGSPVCPDAYCSLDPTAGGNTSRWIAGTQMVADAWDASAYLQFYDWHMQSNPTYDAQINQFDRRTTAGGRVNRTLVDTLDLDFNVGAEFRYDDIGPVGLDENDAGQYVSNISNNDIRETSVGAYAEGSWRPTTDLRLLAGLRADYYDFDVTAINPTSFAGSATDSQVSPSAGIAYAASNNVSCMQAGGADFIQTTPAAWLITSTRSTGLLRARATRPVPGSRSATSN